jgi:DNA-directed RNA polymerase specialized sigma24 family protein
MIFLEGLGYREIAHRLGIPEGTVKSRTWTCRRRLRELLDQNEPPPPSDDRDPRKDRTP